MGHLHMCVGEVWVEMSPWPFTSPISGNEAQSMEMISVKEQETTAATARLKEEPEYRTIVLEIKTHQKYPPSRGETVGAGAQNT